MINVNLVRFIYNENIVPNRLGQPFFWISKLTSLSRKRVKEEGRTDC